MDHKVEIKERETIESCQIIKKKNPVEHGKTDTNCGWYG